MVAAVVIVGGAYLLTAGKSQAPSTSNATTTPVSNPASNATSTAGVGQGSRQTGTKPQLVTPDYKKPIAFRADVSADIRAQLTAKLKIVQAQIAANQLNMGAWTNLGTLHKQGGDYANAALYWEFVVTTYSGPASPNYSLGDLYQNFLHDNAKAEARYLSALQEDPHNVNAYASLYTLYHYTLHDDAKAAAILARGLTASPGNNYLLSLKAELNKK